MAGAQKDGDQAAEVETKPKHVTYESMDDRSAADALLAKIDDVYNCEATKYKATYILDAENHLFN